MTDAAATPIQIAYCRIMERLEVVPEGAQYATGYRRGLEAALRALVLVDPDAPGAWESPPAGRQPDGSYLVY